MDLRHQSRHPNKKATAQGATDLLASQRNRRDLTISKSNKIRIDRAKVREAKKYDGKWFLETNDGTISMQDAAGGYKGLMVIERCFRALKRTQIKMTPMFHWVPRRIETHVRICLLALSSAKPAQPELLRYNYYFSEFVRVSPCKSVVPFSIKVKNKG
jgi:transposase